MAAILGKKSGEIDPTQRLVDAGLDSYGFVELITELESKYGVHFEEEELMSSSLESIDKISELIQRKR